MSDQEATPQPANEEGGQPSRQADRTAGGGSRERGRRRHGGQPSQPRRSEPSLPMDELRDLVELIAANGFTEFELEREGFRVRLRRDLAPQIVAAPQAMPTPVPPVGLPPASSAPHPSASAGASMAAAAAATPHPGAQAEQAASADEDLHIVTSPIVGTFYRAPSPTAEPFVRIGSHVDPDSVVCIIEAMKLMNEIQAETTGEIAKIYVENGQPVEFGQPLFGVKK